MKLHTTGHVACLLLVCTIILQVYSAPLEDCTKQQTAAANRNETGPQGDSSHVSADVGKRSADGDSPSEKEDTEDSTHDQEQDDTSTEDTEDTAYDETDTRRRRNANYEQRGKQRGDEVKSEEDGGLTREAAVVAPLRRRRGHHNKTHTDVSTTEPAGHDDTSSDTNEDTESTVSSTDTLYRRREAETSTVGTLHGSPVIVVAQSGISVKKITQDLDQTLQKLEQRIDSFEEAAIGLLTVPIVGVLAGDSMKQHNGTITHTT